jgi:hypothetical protein
VASPATYGDISGPVSGAGVEGKTMKLAENEWPPRAIGPIGKGKPKLAEKMDNDRTWQALDKSESEKVKRRSKGICEVVAGGRRCHRRASEVHHHIGGWKLRGRGISALAKNKTHACSTCHPLITGNVLEHVAGNTYRRIA